jgi:hypothetical protein
MVGPHVCARADHARLSKPAGTPRFEVCKHLLDRIRGRDHGVDVVGPHLDPPKAPPAMLAHFTDSRMHHESSMLVELGGRVCELLAPKSLAGGAGGEELRAGGVVGSVYGAVLVAMEVSAVGVKGEEVGRERHGGSVSEIGVVGKSSC